MKITPAIRNFLAEAGRKGGSSTSEKKKEAVRRNGAKGGRPKGVKNGAKKFVV